jgi:hypothetical protein
VADISNRSALARWRWKAEKARTALIATFSAHDRQLVGEWCSFDESMRMDDDSRRLGASPARVIQRWATRQRFIEAFRSCEPVPSQLEYIYVLVMDMPDAAWVRVRFDLLSSDLVPAAAAWLTDGFIALDPESESLISVDVEENDGSCFIETTFIGDMFHEIRDCLNDREPLVLEIIDQSRKDEA